MIPSIIDFVDPCDFMWELCDVSAGTATQRHVSIALQRELVFISEVDSVVQLLDSGLFKPNRCDFVASQSKHIGRGLRVNICKEAA